jgi:hypothetical protein
MRVIFGFEAYLATSISLFSDVKIFSRERMTVYAASLTCSLSRGALASKTINSVRDRFEMAWVYALDIATKVVYLAPVWYLTYKKMISSAVRQYWSVVLVFWRRSPDHTVSNFIYSSSPLPTTCNGVDLELLHESVDERAFLAAPHTITYSIKGRAV